MGHLRFCRLHANHVRDTSTLEGAVIEKVTLTVKGATRWRSDFDCLEYLGEVESLGVSDTGKERNRRGGEGEYDIFLPPKFSLFPEEKAHGLPNEFILLSFTGTLL